MIKIPKENIKYFIIIVGGLALAILITIIVDINYFHKDVFQEEEVDKTEYVNTKESKFEEKKYEVVSEKRRVLYYADEIMDMINNKEYDKLYSVLDEGYRKLYVSSVDVLKEDMKKFADDKYIVNYDEYYKEENMYLINIRFEKSNLTREDILNGTAQPIDTWCIREIEKGKYTVAFNGFIDKYTMNEELKNNLVRIKLKELTLREDSTEILVNIENLTDEKVTLYDNRLDIYFLHKYVNNKHVDTNTINKEIEPKKTVTYKLRFPNIYSKASKPLALRFMNIYGSDGEKTQIKFDMSKVHLTPVR